jgi:hypothetical protein
MFYREEIIRSPIPSDLPPGNICLAQSLRVSHDSEKLHKYTYCTSCIKLGCENCSERERERDRVYSSRKPLPAAAAAASGLWGGNMTLITLHALYIYGRKEVRSYNSSFRIILKVCYDNYDSIYLDRPRLEATVDRDSLWCLPIKSSGF